MKVNDYVRTKSGEICKLDYYDEKQERWITYDNAFETGVKISSSNIIDLIEIGDLVKIEYYAPRYHTRLTRLFEVEYKDNDWIRFCNSHCDLSIFHNQWGGKDSRLKPVIKSILTKEQFERCEYKI